MNEQPKIVKCFISKNGNYDEEKKYEYRLPYVAYVLYSDYTWEKLIVYDGDFYRSPQNMKFNAGTKLKNKTRAEAINIIAELIITRKLNGHLLV